MSTMICEKEDCQVYTPAKSSASAEKSARTQFTRQTGQALIALGTLLKHVPPFNETVDKNTGDTLISIGKKLKK